MRTAPLCDAFGVELLDIDVRDVIDETTAVELRRLLDEHLLLVVRGQHNSAEEQVRFLETFGNVYSERPTKWSFVSNIVADSSVPEGKLLFHSDLAFTPVPLPVISLQAVVMPPGGAPTLFANAERALGCLGADVRAQLEGRDAFHVYDLAYALGDRRFRDAEVDAANPRQVHPAIKPNPRNGRNVLYVSEMQTDRIVGLEPAASDEVLEALFDALYAESNVYELDWRQGDLAIWDNVALQHGRRELPPTGERTLRRVVVAEHGVGDQVPNAGELLARYR